MVSLLFAPTRSHIGRIETSLSVSTTADYGFRRVLMFESVCPTGHDVTIYIHYTGEPPELLSVTWSAQITGKSELHYHAPETPAEFLAILDGRRQIVCEARSKGNRRHAFLFDLDRMTNKQFLEFATELTPHEIRLRMETVTRLFDGLWSRLEARQGANKSPQVDDNDLRLVTDIIRAAARNLDQHEPEKHVGAALLEFAAGTLKRSVAYDNAGHRYTVAEPNSSALFLFAELGIAARHLEPRFWTPQLLLDLVKMQRYYIHRFRHSGDLSTFHNPTLPLDKCIRADIDREFDGYDPNNVSLDDLIGDNIRLAGQKRPKPKSCVDGSPFE